MSDPSGETSGLLRRVLPRGLFLRSLLIIIVPIVLLQLVVTYLFFERHYDVTTTRLCRAVGANIAILVRLHDRFGGLLPLDDVAATATESLGMTFGFLAGERLPETPSSQGGTLNDTLQRELDGQLPERFWFDTGRSDGYVDIRVELPGGVLRVLAERKFVVATNTHIFLVYMVAASSLLIVVAVMFLRNQVRPIQRLAKVAEAVGKGREVPVFRPSGASEVRAAGAAVLEMRERIARHLQQRTDMLAGVSHDLRTPLTRMKLQLAMMPDGPDAEALKSDVGEMEQMLAAYLDFARGTGGEQAVATDVGALLAEVVETARRGLPPGEGHVLTSDIAAGLTAKVRRDAFRRAVMNLLGNALKYGQRVRLSARREGGLVHVAVDDNGPGIPPDQREAAFRPFVRLDAARNLDRAGVGLGLAIARDIAHSHGGEIELSDSMLGGLRAELRVPV